MFLEMLLGRGAPRNDARHLVGKTVAWKPRRRSGSEIMRRCEEEKGNTQHRAHGPGRGGWDQATEVFEVRALLPER